MKPTNEPYHEIPNVKHKSSVFHMLFSDPDILRELYSAIEGVELPPDVPININTLSNVIVMGKLNDISFEIDKRLVILIEHQSTINNNLPFRCLEYIIRVYRRMFDTDLMHQRTLVKIPKPEFIVLYNGIEPFDDYKEIKLSDAFFDVADLTKDAQKLTLELVTKVYNINDGRNPEMLHKSETLNGYSVFIGKIRECQRNGMTLEESLETAVKYCIERGIIADFLRKHGAEVINMWLEEGTVENTVKAYYKDGLNQGIEIGQKRGEKIGEKKREQEIARNMKNRGRPLSEIIEDTGLPPEVIIKL